MNGFVIVKYAEDPYWEGVFGTDPKKGVLAMESAHDTYSGKQANLKECYPTVKSALEDLKVIRGLNPTCGYAICPIL